jgi:translation elongation factor P/translation initiation factor 5A
MEVIAAKLIIYTDDTEEYYTFITPEAYDAITFVSQKSKENLKSATEVDKEE